MATMGLRAAGRLLAPLVSLQRTRTTLYISRTVSINSYKQQLPEQKDLIYKDDPDSFGMISRTNKIFTQRYEVDEDDMKEEKFLSEHPLDSAKLSTKKYADLIKDHIENKRIKEALDVLEIRMLQEDRVKPENYIYNLLIGGCARVGYTKKAFRLFNDMKRRGLVVTGGTYTSLFNACSNSPWIEDGLKRAKGLRELMIEKQYEPNLTNYNAMIKAFGRCGDLVAAFQIVDEMAKKGIKIRVHTFNFLLQSCISDKTSGYRHALLTWRKMLKNKEKPNIYSFNLMLKCIKECGLGENKLKDVIENIIPEAISDRKPNLRLSSDHNVSDEYINKNTMQNEHNLVIKPSDGDMVSANILPNLLSRIPHMGSVISLNEINSAEDRFVLAGGMNNFFDEMKKNNITPDIKTFTQMLHVTPNTLDGDEAIMEKIREFKVKTDIDFYNMLIKRRCYRLDYESARSVISLIENENKIRYKGFYTKKSKLINPDIVTYGVLALSCNTKDIAIDFLTDMKEKRIKLNAEILGTLLQHGRVHLDLDYVSFIMNLIKDEKLSINKKFLDHLEVINLKCKKIIKNKGESKANDENPHKKFTTSYKKWLNEININDVEESAHPWSQFRENQPETFQHPRKTKKKSTHYRVQRKTPKYVVKM